MSIPTTSMTCTECSRIYRTRKVNTTIRHPRRPQRLKQPHSPGPLRPRTPVSLPHPPSTAYPELTLCTATAGAAPPTSPKPYSIYPPQPPTQPPSKPKPSKPVSKRVARQRVNSYLQSTSSRIAFEMGGELRRIPLRRGCIMRLLLIWGIRML